MYFIYVNEYYYRLTLRYLNEMFNEHFGYKYLGETEDAHIAEKFGIKIVVPKKQMKEQYASFLFFIDDAYYDELHVHIMHLSVMLLKIEAKLTKCIQQIILKDI